MEFRKVVASELMSRETKSITAKADANPSLVIQTMKKFRSELNVAFNTLAKIMTKEDIDSLKKSFQAIDEIILKYK